MAAGGHFGWPKITAISDQYSTLIFLIFFSQNGCRRPFWMTENHFRSHFSPFQINTQLWFFFSQNGCRWPFWMTENHFRSHFAPFQINTQLFFSQNGCRRPFWMTENHIRSHFSPFQINTQLYNFFDFFHKMVAGGHFGWPKITFDRISHHFRSIRNLNFFHKMVAGGHFGWPKITFDRISHHFRSIRNFYFFSQNGCRRPFWMTENHFRSHFSPFQINTQLWFFFHKMAAGGHFGWTKIAFGRISHHFRSIQLWFFFTKWLPAAILDDRKSLSNVFFNIFQNGHRRPFWKSDLGHFGWPKITFDRISRHFRSIHHFFFLNLPLAAILEVRFAPKTIGFFHYVLSMAMPNMKQLKQLNRGHFVFPIDAKNHKVLVIWELNGYGEYDWCICDKVMACTSIGVWRWRKRRRNQKHNTPEIFKFRGYNYQKTCAICTKNMLLIFL